MRGHATDTGIGAEIGRTRGTGDDPTRKIYGRRRSRLRNHTSPRNIRVYTLIRAVLYQSRRGNDGEGESLMKSPM